MMTTPAAAPRDNDIAAALFLRSNLLDEGIGEDGRMSFATSVSGLGVAITAASDGSRRGAISIITSPAAAGAAAANAA
jgi:hypothetical protein